MKLASLASCLVVASLAPGSAPAQAPGRAEGGPQLWSVIAGVETFPGPIAARHGARSRGRQLARWVSEKAGWGPDHVLELNDDGGNHPDDPKALTTTLRPTRANLDWALEKWLGARVKPGDVVLISYFGRGRAGPEGGSLLTIDARPEGEGWSPDRWIDRMIVDFKCSAALCWVDAPMPGPPGAADRLLARLARWPGSSAWMATGEPSAEADGFAPALLAALGDGHRTLLATLTDLERHPKASGFRFRQLGGFSPALVPARGSLKGPDDHRATLLIQKGHADRVSALAMRADGRALISAGDDSTIRVWDPSVPGRALLRVLPDFLNGVTAIAIGPEGRYLAGGDGMGNVLAWDLSDDGTAPIKFNGRKPHDRVKGLAFLPAEALAGGTPPPRFVSIGKDGECFAWAIDKGNLRAQAVAAEGAAGELLLASASRRGGPAAFAVVGESGRLRAFDGDIKPTRAVTLGGARPSALRLDAEGRRAIVGAEDGRLRVVDLATGTIVLDRAGPGGPVSALGIGPDSLLAVAAGGSITLISPDRPDAAVRLESGPDPVESVEFSPDGGRIAAMTRLGDLLAWSIGPDRTPTPLKLDRSGGEPPIFSAMAFGPASSKPMLAAGEADGGIRRWDLATLKEYPRLTPYRGQVARLGVAPDGRSLLQLTRDGIAQVWDLQEGRVVRTLAGAWTAGAMLPGGRLAMARSPNLGGGVVVVDAKEGRPVPGVSLAEPAGVAGEFARVVASKDGRRVAASEAPGRGDLVAVWDVEGGGPPRTFVHREGASTVALGFSDDGKTLMTGGSDGSIRLWDLDGPGGLNVPAVKYEGRKSDAVTAAAIGPGPDPRRVVVALATADDPGAVYYWDGGPGRPKPLGSMAGKVLAVAFAGGGRYAVAAGEGRRLRVWDLSLARPDAAEVAVRVSPGRPGAESSHHHFERINDLATWPIADGPSLVSGSDDATTRFWRIEPDPDPRRASLQLLGTIAGAPEGPMPGRGAPAEAGRVAPARVDAPWVVFTPDAVYDASLDGEKLVSFSDGRGITPLDQFSPRLFQPLLSDRIRRGMATPPRPFRAPPPLVIEPVGEPAPDQAVVEIKVSLGDRALKGEDLRLYQNDAPVRDGSGFREAGPGEFVATVPLIRGDNRLYAMAGRPDNDVDARSKDLILFHTSPDRPGRTHVIALGIGRYLRNALEYPVADARRIAEYVQGHGVGSGREPGEKIVLADAEVDSGKVLAAFDRVRSRVKNHPEDTVVVFLAGHTDILASGPDGQARYSLLLSRFPFPESDPDRAVLRGPNLALQVRSAPAGTYLPYSTIYRNLATLDALRRIIIVDACQAEAIVDDPGVRRVEQLKTLEGESRRTSPSYFLASRRGEPAEEATELKHGLLTYVMLRGMGAPGLEPAPGEVVALRENRDADGDGDGVVTTRELHRFVDLALPALADRLPGRVRAPRPLEPAPAGPGPAESPRVQAAGPSFPLVVVPRGPTVADHP